LPDHFKFDQAIEPTFVIDFLDRFKT
jgi:hypothetical protein